MLTLPLRSLLMPTPYTKGSRPDPPAISKTVALMNFKSCRVIATSLNVLEMLSCLHSIYLVTISTPQRTFVLSESAKFQQKNTNVQFDTKFKIFKITL